MFGPFKKKPEDFVEKNVEKNESVENSGINELADETELSISEEVEQVAKDLYDAAQQEIVSLKDQISRVGADFKNYQMRSERDRTTWAQSIKEDMIFDLLPVIDNFDRALEHAKKTQTSEDFKSWLSGFELIYKSLEDVLKKNNVEVISQMTHFDPNLHEALMQVDAQDKESGTIIAVFERGFVMNGRTLRPAKVSVAK